MKTFKDLQFKPPRHFTVGSQALMTFENGYGVSVINGDGAYVSSPDEWEVAVMHNGRVCCSTPITDDVLGHLTVDEVNEVMQKVQELPTL